MTWASSRVSIFPLCVGIPSLHFAASDWLLRPEVLFRYIQEYRASLCWLPNFAFSYMAQRKEMMESSYSLSHVRAWINCSEPVRRKSVRDFAERFADWGVAPGSLQSSYAMAENVFAVTQSAPGKSLPTVARSQVKGASLSSQSDVFELIDDEYVSSGRCLKGMRLRIIGKDGLPCLDFVAGEIHLQTACLFQGYWDRDGFRRDAFASSGWFHNAGSSRAQPAKYRAALLATVFSKRSRRSPSWRVKMLPDPETIRQAAREAVVAVARRAPPA
jgi:acyl-CoA synthetase (AMP-forming)/AMP-acid ligase II